jgi:Ca2+-transporting ATPase
MVMGPEYVPLLPAAILYINLATDGLPALALGVAPADPDIMQRSPRDPRESIFSKDIRMLILMAILIECPIFLWMFFSSQPDMERARTVVFFMFVFIELIIAVNFRSLRYSLIQAPPHKWLLIAIAWELALIVVLIQFPAVRNAFGITMPSVSDIGMIVALGVGIVIVIEMAKAGFRTTARGRTMTAYAERE